MRKHHPLREGYAVPESPPSTGPTTAGPMSAMATIRGALAKSPKPAPIMHAARLPEIVLPETTPATEWILNRPVQKMSPTRKHGVLQAAICEHLRRWARGRGQVASEWRFRVTVPGEDVHPLVPDIAYMPFERLRTLSGRDLELPPIAPEIVVEIVSPDDRPKDLIEKRRVYFAFGVTLIFSVDPEAGTVTEYDRKRGFENPIRTVRGAETKSFSPRSFSDLNLPLEDIFSELEIPPP